MYVMVSSHCFLSSVFNPLLVLLFLYLVVERCTPEKLEDESNPDDQSNKDLCETTESTAPPMDDLLYECFYTAIRSSIKKDDLPVLTSTFYRSHMMPLW